LKVLVVGNAVLDIAYEVEALPTTGQTLLARTRRATPGGKGLNQAILARRAGADVDFWAVVGEDAAGATILACLRSERLGLDGLTSWSGPTDESVVVVADSGENLIVSTAHASRALSVWMAKRAVAGLGRGDLVLLQGNLTAEVTRSCLEEARRRSCMTILNPAPVAFDYTDLWPLVDIGIANEVETRVLGGDLDEEAAAKALLRAGSRVHHCNVGVEGRLLHACPRPDLHCCPQRGGARYLRRGRRALRRSRGGADTEARHSGCAPMGGRGRLAFDHSERDVHLVPHERRA
jgi:ribokinase